MTMRPLELGRQSNVGRHPHAGVARLINLYAEAAGPEGKVQFPLYAVSGLGAFATLVSGGGIARMITTSNGIIVKAGRSILRVDTAGASSLLGGFPSDDLTTMARNNRPGGEQIAVCGGGALGIVSGSVLTMVTDPDVGSPTSVFELGGYFITAEADGNARASELLDGTSWDGLSVEQIGRDLLVGKPRGRDGVFFGARTTHIWTLNEGDTFPLSPRSTLNVGAWSAGGVIEANGTLYWLSTTDQGSYAGVRVLTGDTTQTLSSPYVDRAVSRETNPSLVTGTAWSEGGRTFLAWSGPSWTHVLDLTTGQWHERSSLIDGVMSRWRVEQAVQSGSNLIAGDYASATLYRLGQVYNDEAGSSLVTTLQVPPLTAYPGRVEVNELHLDIIPGVGLASGGSEDTSPQVAMTWSVDGETWSTELLRSIGAQGRTGGRVNWRRLGTQGVHGRTYRFSASANVVRGILSAAVDVEGLPA
jgi:hypothetical protein